MNILAEPQKAHCPTVPTPGSGTAGQSLNSGTALGTPRGTVSLKALAYKVLFPAIAGQRVGQTMGQDAKKCPKPVPTRGTVIEVSHGLESIPDRPPSDADFWEWHGAIDLKDIARQYGLKVSRSVRGSIVVVCPVPVNFQLVEYADDSLRDCRGYLAKFADIPTISPAEALAEFRRMGGSVQTVQGGFVPVYPEAWPGYVQEAAQGLFLAGIDAIEAEARRDIEAAGKRYSEPKGK